ncbi:MAG: ABC transporter ATP-binding protein [Phycisphaeraceae bacterium]|nr:ABC transporter ATP-binding protein [Phycisphaeraceae bacterium]
MMTLSGQPAIRTVDMRVDYDDLTAVHDLNLTIEPGEVFGLIGPNGAGKTSTLRVLGTLQQPTYGQVHIAGYDVEEHPAEIHRLLGFMPDAPPVYDDLKCWEMLDVFARAYFVDRRQRRKRVDQCLADVELTAKRNVLAGTLSRGMKQRLILAKTLLHDPLVLLLDEPASGLDPMARIEFRHLMRNLAARGRTVIVSSHILSELSDFCTSIGIMEKGLLVESGRIEQIASRINSHRKLIIEVTAGMDIAQRLLGERGIVVSVDAAIGRIILEFPGTEAELPGLLAALVTGGVSVKAFYEKKMGVEDILLRVGARRVS